MTTGSREPARQNLEFGHCPRISKRGDGDIGLSGSGAGPDTREPITPRLLHDLRAGSLKRCGGLPEISECRGGRGGRERETSSKSALQQIFRGDMYIYLLAWRVSSIYIVV